MYSLKVHFSVDRMTLARRMNIENSPHLVIPDATVLDHLYSVTEDDMEKLLQQGNDEAALELKSQEPEYWFESHQ